MKLLTHPESHSFGVWNLFQKLSPTKKKEKEEKGGRKRRIIKVGKVLRVGKPRWRAAVLCCSRHKLAHKSLHLFSNLYEWLLIGSLKLIMVGVFTPQKPEIATNQGSFSLQRTIHHVSGYMGTLCKNNTLSKTKPNQKTPNTSRDATAAYWEFFQKLGFGTYFI